METEYANLDLSRKARRGFPESVFCEGKTASQVRDIFLAIAQANGLVVATRATEEQYTAVCERMPEAQYHKEARLITYTKEPIQAIGRVAVCTGGTSDIPVASEAAVVAEMCGARVERYYDMGIAGIHRIINNIDAINQANVIIAASGMEGALPGVIAGLVDKPVIALPTSVGYGASFGGLSALLTMLNTCAEGVSVVNIDNGFGAGYLAAQINRLIAK